MSILASGSSALLAFQRALATVSHNVANAATPGYSRQRVELAARPGQPLGNAYIGSGVDVARLQRLADGLVFARSLDSNGELGRLQQLSSLSDRVDELLTDPATSLSRPWSAFFAAAEAVTADPASTVARNQLLATGEQLAARWRMLDGELAQMSDEVDKRIAGLVADANRLAAEIANLNRDIVSAGSNASPDLLDARALRVEQLARIVGANTVEQDDGALNVFTAGGQALVLGTRSMALAAGEDPYDPGRVQLSLASPSGPVPLPAASVSGEIGGLLEFRDRVLDPARAELGRLATAFATAFNTTQAAGVDYRGNPGTAMFALPGPGVSAHAANGGGATLAANVADLGALQGAPLTLRYDGTGWNAIRSDSGEPVPMTGIGTAADPLRVAGLSVVVSGTAASGDRFQLQPTLGAASGLRVLLKDPAGIAAAAPLQARTDNANLGSARPGTAAVTDPAAFAAFSGATIEFLDATQYTIDGIGPYTYTAGTPIAGSGWSLALDGMPAAGDRFLLSRTPPRSTDNGNARALAALDDRRLLDGGNVSLDAGLGQLTARIGSDARHAELSLEAQQAIHAQVTAERESVSGVNLDEEAADMLRFQQAYQAAAEVIATADRMFQALLGAVRR